MMEFVKLKLPLSPHGVPVPESLFDIFPLCDYGISQLCDIRRDYFK